jgi:glycosyltransferase involved in cell wall biosynthesis
MASAVKPHLAVMVVPGGDTWLGGVNYVKNLVRTLRISFAQELTISLVQHADSETAIYQDLAPELDGVICLDDTRAPIVARMRFAATRLLGHSLAPKFEQRLRERGVTLCYSNLLRLHRQDGPIKCASWIPDFQFIREPEGSNRQHGSDQIANCKFVAKNAKRIVLSSADAERDCHQYFPESVGHTHVYRFRSVLDPAIFATDPMAVVSHLGLPERFLLVPNLLAPTKNHLAVIRALTILKAEGLNIRVLCSGSLYDYRNPGFANTIFKEIFRCNVADQIQFTGPLARADQLQLMRACTAILQPSQFEGWNTGVEEARAMGKALLLSTLAVHQEQVQSAHWFDPNDVQALAAQMRQAFLQLPGFDRTKESRARDAYQQEIQRAGREFLEIYQ